MEWEKLGNTQLVKTMKARGIYGTNWNSVWQIRTDDTVHVRTYSIYVSVPAERQPVNSAITRAVMTLCTVLYCLQALAVW